MEIIRKKISLEEFKSRVPGLIPTIDNNVNSWNNIPYNIPINDLFKKELGNIDPKVKKIYTYRFVIDLYSIMMNNVMNSDFYMYNSSTSVWIPYNIVSTDEIISDKFLGFRKNLIFLNPKNKDIVCIVNQKDNFYIEKGMGIINEDIRKITDNNSMNVNEYSFIRGVKEYLQDINVPYEVRGPLTPKFLFKYSIKNYIDMMDNLKKMSKTNCCYKNDYEKNGGDSFKNWLEENNSYKIKDLTEEEKHDLEPCISIPLLLTSKVCDLGVLEVYKDDSLEDNELPIIPEEDNKELAYSIEESKLQSLKRRKVSYDEDGNELPGIIEKDTSKLKTLYPSKNVRYTKYENNNKVEEYDDSEKSGENYLRNIEVVNGGYYGDYIYDTEIRWEIKESNTFNTEQNGLIKEKREYIDENPQEGKTKREALRKVYDIVNENISNLKKEIKNELEQKFKNDKDICYIVQDYEMKYKIKYYKTVEDDNNNVTEEEVIEDYNTKGRIIYTISGKIIFTYVIGGMLFRDPQTDILEINELPTNPIGGVWYIEEYDMIPDKKIGKYVYDDILFEKKKTSYTFNGIDYTRRNITFTDLSWHNWKNSKLNETNYFTFRDEKYNGISFPLKEKINIVMDRGSSSAFERQMKLLETKTFSDLENYGNNYFNI